MSPCEKEFFMRQSRISRRSFLRASGLLAAAAALGGSLAGCGAASTGAESESASASAPAAAKQSAHEPVTIMDANRDYTQLMELVHQKYPEIQLQIMPYRGRNTSAYMKKQLESDHLPDIYNTTQVWDDSLQAEHLLDLAKYPVTDLYNPARLNEVDVSGSVYLLPYDFSVSGMFCNISLLQRNDIAVPRSFAQLRDETIPALTAAGINVSDCMMNLPGFPFQYFFNAASTGYVNTLEGRQWQEDFIHGNADASALQSSVDFFQQWIDCGMVNYAMGTASNNEVGNHFSENNTAFLMCITSNLDDTDDHYELLPFFSEDGSQSVYITSPARYYGLSKHLEEAGNEQKLEDALHILEVLSTPEGYESVMVGISSTMCSIKDFALTEDSPYYDVMEAINNGYSAPMIYAKWTDYVVPVGTQILNWIQGKAAGSDLIPAMNELQQQFLANGTTYYANVTEELENPQIAQLCGQIFMEAAGTDAALISYNIYYEDVPASQENSYGANGPMLPGELSEEDITAFLPTGWYDTLQVITKPGSYLKQLAAEGCDMRGNGHPYPYVFLTKDGQPLDDDTEYTCVLCGYAGAKKDELAMQDTGIVGLDAAKEYLLSVGEVSSALLDDSLLQKEEA